MADDSKKTIKEDSNLNSGVLNTSIKEKIEEDINLLRQSVGLSKNISDTGNNDINKNMDNMKSDDANNQNSDNTLKVPSFSNSLASREPILNDKSLTFSYEINNKEEVKKENEVSPEFINDIRDILVCPNKK